MDLEEKITAYAGKRIYYQTTGRGNPVILLHGFGEDHRIWHNQVDHLSKNFYLILPDLPGTGKSELLDDMSIDEMAEAIHAIIHHEISLEQESVLHQGGMEDGAGGFTVIGHSMGGYITLALVEKYYNHLNAFGLFHSTAYADPEEKKALRRKGIGFIMEHGPGEFLKSTLPNLFSPNSQSRIPNSIEELVRRGKNFSGTALVSYYEAMMARPDRTNLLQTTNMPVLFIMGKYDGAVPFEDTLMQCHLPEKSYIHILRISAHMGMLEEMEKSNQILTEFIMQH